VLLVVAHPDNEYEMAGTVYRIAKELSGTVDQSILTNGETGFNYSSLAEACYGMNLAEEAAGRKQLAHSRVNAPFSHHKSRGARDIHK